MTDSLPPQSAASDAPSTTDEHGHDPAEYDWYPVLRKRRVDGWSPEKQRCFIEALADCCSITDAARAVDMTVVSCYRLRRSPGAESFAAAWDAAIGEASKRLVDVAFERAVNGTYEPIINMDGHRVGARVRYNDRLLMFLLRAHAPERYAREMKISLDHEQSPLVADAIKLLAPAKPENPAALMEPEALETALDLADILEGKIPHWHRDPEPVRYSAEPPLGEEFERLLEAAKREADGLPPLAEGETDETEREWENEITPRSRKRSGRNFH